MRLARRHLFKQADVCRAIKGARAAGEKLSRAEITAEGKITLIFADNGPVIDPESKFDEWKAKHDARSS